MGEWTVEYLAGVIGILFSMAFSFIPGLREWFDALDPWKKVGITIGLAVLVSAAVFGISCWTPYAYVTCDWAGVSKLVDVFVAYLLANQLTYVITHKVRPTRLAE